jgi:integrase/recombinase XerC
MAHFPKPWFRPNRGVWYVQVDGKQVNLGPDRDRAMEAYHALMAEPRGGPKALDSGSLVELVDLFLDWCQKHRAPRTYDWYRERCQSFVSHPGVAALRVEQLKPLHLQQWADAKAWSGGMRRGAMTAVQRSMNWAAKMGHIKLSPVAHVEKPPQGQRELVITPDRFAEILARYDDEPFRNLLHLAWETGARPQELLRVEARDVDLDGGRWMFTVKQSKGKKRARVVQLTDRALEICRPLVKKYPTGPILRNVDGKPWTPFAVNCRFERLRKKLGVKYCLYTFRHSFCQRGLKNGVDPVTLANLMGHVDATMIARVYSHVAQDQAYLKDSLRRATA